MQDTVVRLNSISIENFKNVINGQLSFANTRKKFRTSVLGLYGQNGSGKTTLIDALELLKLLLMGQPIPAEFADYINVDAESAAIHYSFSVVTDKEEYETFYDVELKSEVQESVQNTDIDEMPEKEYKVVLVSEILSYAYEGNENKVRKSALINTTSSGSDRAFVPAAKYNCLIGGNKKTAVDLIVVKKLTENTSRSFVFSRELLTAIRNTASDKADIEYVRHVNLLESLVRYGNYELFVVNTKNSGMISMNALPLAFKYDIGLTGAVGNIMISLEYPLPIPVDAVSVVRNVIKNMNVVLLQIVPGLTIGIRELGEMTLQNGKRGQKIQLMSLKNDKEIPLQYESEGIKKIISILQLLIVVYNSSLITVAIDELDAGIFEYLLGELLRIISEKGKGQLIFTSHNLRPLETIDSGFIAFTTTNPANRYIRMSNLKDNNNLRDFYFRDIVLGEQREEVYDSTNNAEIALAFREAGDFSGT